MICSALHCEKAIGALRSSFVAVLCSPSARDHCLFQIEYCTPSPCLQLVMEGDLANLDVTAPGAILGLALMYLQTGDRSVADTFSVPSTAFELDFVRPDFILLRVLARALVLWSEVRPTEDWLLAQLPPILQVRHLWHICRLV